MKPLSAETFHFAVSRIATEVLRRDLTVLSYRVDLHGTLEVTIAAADFLRVYPSRHHRQVLSDGRFRWTRLLDVGSIIADETDESRGARQAAASVPA